MTDEVVIEIEGEVEPKTAVVGKRVEKKIKDLSKEETARIIEDIKAGLIYDNVDIKTFKNGSARLINKKSVPVAKTIPKEEPEVKEVQQKKTVLSDTQYYVSELLKMQELVLTEKNKRKKLKKRFTELDELLNIMEDTEVEKPLEKVEKVPETIEEKVPEVVPEEITKDKPQMIPPRAPTRRGNWRQQLTEQNKNKR